MLQDLTPASFEAHLGTPFRIHFGGEAPLETMLQELKRHEHHPGAGARPEPFSAYFRGPRNPVLPQAIYRVEHAAMPTLEIFLVPVGPDPKQGGMLYEAVFT